ncbi:hypothetical protein SPRG_10464 [Saprolegnia parasitica CBS 223.65]|uniref:RNase III domain-containing protein n=1 Tax=Saprolegnia parasitica (strain CBS 223.65) TaxID=695850 RepID=A0A067CC37_SAPPC|nr:hypothetical protein SPRG_10464 [Saprolegnia parasitica CBS 223.65]KDO24387.1 hypothetical protein SPRG_10464 [Saprolegnia parasitica CBS 223.65]|eukprot:XP_012204979.1 hypothetical protein SPRG_10464 [Saprolegnia parasitica CBS 223.65]
MAKPRPAGKKKPGRGAFLVKRTARGGDKTKPSSRAIKPRIDEAQRRANEIMEWLGDAVLDELVGRSLLRHVQLFCSTTHDNDLSNLDLFRELRSTLVTNANLSCVYDKLFPAKYTILLHPLKLKEKADLVEVLVGRIAARSRPTPSEIAKLDSVLSHMLHVEFTQWAVQAEADEKSKVNQFELLQELLDDSDLSDLDNSSSSDAAPVEALLSSPVEEPISVPYHAFATVKELLAHAVPASAQVASLLADVAALRTLATDPTHVLQTSRVMFEIFKMYGMSVLKERSSACLLFETQLAADQGKLTWVRQEVLSLENLAGAAIALGLASPAASSRVQANSLRALVGFATAMNHTRAVNALAAYVVYLHHLRQRTHLCRKSACALGFLENRRVLFDDVNAWLLHEDSTCAHSFELFYASVWTSLPPTIALSALPKSVDATSTFLQRRQLPPVASDELTRLQSWLPDRWCDLDTHLVLQAPTLSRKRKRARSDEVDVDAAKLARKSFASFALLQRFQHRRFLYCLETLVVAFAKNDVRHCDTYLHHLLSNRRDDESDELAGAMGCPKACCVTEHCLSLALKDNFYRLLMHELCLFHRLLSSSKTVTSGARVTQIRRPPSYVFSHDTFTDVAVAIVL